MKGSTAIGKPEGLAGAATFGALLNSTGEDCSDRLNAMSLADWNRCSRSFSRQCWTTRSSAGEMFLPDSDSSGGSSRRMAAIVSALVSRRNALAREHLVEDRAEREDVGAVVDRQPLTCSGDM